MPAQNEKLETKDAVRFLLEECRMVLPGVQALFGFQLIAVFNSTFAEKLGHFEQDLHLSIKSSGLAALAAALLMTPARTTARQVPKRSRRIWSRFSPGCCF